MDSWNKISLEDENPHLMDLQTSEDTGKYKDV